MQSHPDYNFIQSITGQFPDIPADRIIHKPLLTEDNIKAIMFGFAPGQKLSEHTAARPVIQHFSSGEAVLTLGEQQHTAQSGTWVHLPPQLPHSISAKTEVIMLLTVL